MALLETATAVFVTIAIVSIAAFWVLSRLVFWSLQAGVDEVRGYYFDEVKAMFHLVVVVIVALAVWPGLSSWAAGAFRWLLEVLT